MKAFYCRKVICILFNVLIILIVSSSIDCYSNVRSYSASKRKARLIEPHPDGKLILTPYIKYGAIDEAKEAARVKDSPLAHNILSYSGFFTVNSTTNSNLFFWFFPAKHYPENAPIMLWLQGGPGFSAMFGLFVEHGPFYIDLDGNLKNRQFSWTNSQSMIYVDSPVGTGFSFTKSDSGYTTSQGDVSRDLYEFLDQFFTLFSDYRKNDFYIGGESYAGKFIPPLALKIHTENQLRDSTKNVNLKGLSLGAPFSDPLSVIEGNAEYFYFMGILDENQKQDIQGQIENLKSLIGKNDLPQALMLLDVIFIGKSPPHFTLFKNVSGYEYLFSILNPVMPPEHYSFVSFLNQEAIQQALHIGKKVTFRNESDTVSSFLIGDTFTSVKPQIGQILDLNYKVLISVGQFDMFVPHTTLYNQIKSVSWKGKEGFQSKKNDRRIWKVDGQLAGYVREFDNLAYVMVRNAGHDSPVDQPKWCLNMMYHFTHGLLL